MRSLFKYPSIVFLLVGFVCGAACTTPQNEAIRAADTVEESEPEQTNQTVKSSLDEALPEEIKKVLEPWKGDLDGMVERRMIRVLATFSKTNYFLDRGEQKGITYEAFQLFEKAINEKLQTGHLTVHVVMVPVTRDRLLPALVEGRGDIAAANLTITPERLKQVDFSDPLYTGVSEIVVSGPSAPPLESLDDLSGKEVVVRASSSYYESLQLLNELFARQGKAPVEVTAAPEYLEDEDLLEMVNTGLIPMVIVDTHKAELWAQIFKDITLHRDIAVATNGQIGWAFRKESPKLREAINAFVKKNKAGTLMGNILLKRYFQSTKWIERSNSAEELKKFEAMVGLLRNYAEMYEFDWLMIAALGYQESRLDQSMRSHAGAIGVMQLLPSTAADPNVGIPDIEVLENNIHAGTKYLRFLRNRYFENEDMDALNKTLFTFASYNAGPARVRGLRRRATEAGLDPNVWFQNVEVVAAKEIGRETVQYVGNIAKYYVAYQRIVAAMERKGQLPVS